MENRRIQTQRFKEIAQLITYMISVFFRRAIHLADPIHIIRALLFSCAEEPALAGYLGHVGSIEKRE